jgi:hypothetical protein
MKRKFEQLLAPVAEHKNEPKMDQQLQQMLTQLVVDPSNALKQLHYSSVVPGTIALTADSLTISWATFTDRLTVLRPSPGLDPDLAVVKWDFQTSTLTFDCSGGGGTEQPRNTSVLWTLLTRCRKVPIDHLSDLIQTKQNDLISQLPVKDRKCLFDLCNILYKFQGSAASPTMKILAEPSDDSKSGKHKLRCYGLQSLDSRQLFLLLNTFWMEIHDIVITLVAGANALSRECMTVFVNPTSQLSTSPWCSHGLVQTSIEAFSMSRGDGHQDEEQTATKRIKIE